ncbi:MAG: M15 family metallopeptidase [Trueperaceae bacterium]|nr:M15 family metallopeptidase [Trueperaceae bacterium]
MFFRLSILIFLSSTISGLAQPLPDCRYDDVPTYHQELSDWQISLLDTIYKLSPTYQPTDLIKVSEAGFGSEKEVRQLMLADLQALNDAARAAGMFLEIQSAFRSYGYQEQTFQSWVNQDGLEAALKSSARAGHSEHQLGTAIDFRSASGPAAWELEDWATTPEGAWLKEHAWQYGFVMSYPKNKEAITCYIYEPWHYRYVGREIAQKLKDSGLSLREWLWQAQ